VEAMEEGGKMGEGEWGRTLHCRGAASGAWRRLRGGEERYQSVTAATRRTERDLCHIPNETESRSPTRIFHSMLCMLHLFRLQYHAI